ncbi:TPA: hypothetical protein ACSP7Z_005114 [Serratia fonticola]
MAKRADSSTFLYHWIKSNLNPNASLGDKYQDSYNTLLLILKALALKSGRTLGTPFGHSCICFTESPVSFMSGDKSKYQPFGFEFNKIDIYRIGGEKVIYCSEEQFKLLPQEMRWKWMRHEPLARTQQAPFGTDFSWEREVRLNQSELQLIGPNEIVDGSGLGNVNFTFTNIYVPSSAWKEKLIRDLQTLLNSCLQEQEGSPDYYWLKEFYSDMMSEYELVIVSLS